MVLAVAVGVISNTQQEFLLAQRPTAGSYPGYWEFPGGKVEAKEISRQALTRELREELGIEVQRAVPLIRVQHVYDQYQVLLDVWRVIEYQGTAYGREGQRVAWVSADQLSEYPLLPANKSIVTAIKLPQQYVFTPVEVSEEKLYCFVQQTLQAGYRLLRFRAHGWNKTQYVRMIPSIAALCAQYTAQLLVDNDPLLLEQFTVAGLHLTSTELFQHTRRPIAANYLLGVSCHNAAELAHAQQVMADFAVLSPVLPTPTHPAARALGWHRFARWVAGLNFPVYALGGMTANQPAIWFAGQGIAALRAFDNTQ